MSEPVAKTPENSVLFTFNSRKIINPKYEFNSTKVYKFTSRHLHSELLDMDYQQSIKNLNHLKNFIRAWDNCYIFFFFNSETNYDIEIYDLQYSAEQKKIDLHLRERYPYAYINNEKTGRELLYYHDSNIGVEYDFFLEQFNYFYCKDPVDIKAVQQQFLMLVEKLKNK